MLAESANLRRMDKSNGTLIKEARKAKVWSQEELAHHAGLSVKTISTAELDYSVRPKTLKTIAETLGIELDLHAERVSA